MDNVLFSIIGLTFFVLGIYVIRTYSDKLNKLRAEGIKITATISKISKSKTKANNAYIFYTVMGQDIRVILDFYSEDMRVGDTVDIYVHKDNPKIYVSDNSGPLKLGLLFVIIGLGAIALSLLI